MIKGMKARIGVVAAAGALALTAASPAMAAQNQAGNSLVNVQIGDVTVLVPVAVAANICDVNVNVLAQQNRGGTPTCTADATSVADPGADVGNSSNTAGDSLVNVQAGDVLLQLPIGVAANVCDVNANVLAEQNRLGQAACDAVATPSAG
jgi:hypothetical protein